MIDDLLSWFHEQRRDLPWRRGTHTYATWVSEIMLQQTRVESVIPFFERWMERFPDVATLAAASEEDVLQYWAGLGYYRRARFLHKAALEVVCERGGQLPDSAAAWMGLPGVGEYTSAAIASIALGEAVPVVDGNVKRVAARYLALDLAADDRKLHKSAAEWGAELMLELLELPEMKGRAARRPGDLNEALMELGATICTPRSPKCGECVLRTSCKVASVSSKSKPEDHPRPAARIKWKNLELIYGWAQSDQGCLLIQRSEGWNPGLWEPPSMQSIAKVWKNENPGHGELGEEICQLRHTITHHKITARVFKLRTLGRQQFTPPDSVPLTGLARKILSKCWE